MPWAAGPPRPLPVPPVPLAELAATARASTAPGRPAAAVTGITHDSRAVRPGDLYAALPGARFHGADFAAQAADLGRGRGADRPGGRRARRRHRPAGADRGRPARPDGRTGRRGLRTSPASDLLQIGITGTSGKTTTAYLVEGGLRAAHAPGTPG